MCSFGTTLSLGGLSDSLGCRWTKYQTMWMYDKVAICERFVNKGLPLIRLDEKFLFYMQVISQLENHKPYHDVRAIR